MLKEPPRESPIGRATNREVGRCTGFFLALLSALLFCASTPASKVLLASLEPLPLAGLLYTGAAIGRAPVVVLERRRGTRIRLDCTNAMRVAGAALFGGVLGPVLLLTALRFTLAGQTHAAAVSNAARGSGASTTSDRTDRRDHARRTLATGSAASATNIASPGTIGAALAVGALPYGASIALYIVSAYELGGTRAQAVFASAPFVGAVLAFSFLGEPLGAAHLAASLLLLPRSLSSPGASTRIRTSTSLLITSTSTDTMTGTISTDTAPRHPPRVTSSPTATSGSRTHPHWPDIHHRHEH